MNDSGEFVKSYLDIYPPELELEKENKDNDNDSAFFIDIEIHVDDNQFHLGLYDKRDSFPISVIQISYLSSNMPSKIFYTSIAAEILRIGRSCTNRQVFHHKSSILIMRATRQGTKSAKLTKVLNKDFFLNHEITKRY